MTSYAVIMAGGAGTRFWPLSRAKRPKQLLRLFSNKTLLEETVDRILPLIPVDRILVVCNHEYRQQILDQVPGLPPENVLAEPAGRNTAPCIAWAACEIHRRQPDSVMCVLPADHYIRDAQRFRQLLEKALAAAKEQNWLITFGIIPTRAHTGYGYLRASKTIAVVENAAFFEVERFVEKPNRERAEEYLAEGSYYWNSGMFIWRTGLILEELGTWVPGILRPLQEFYASGREPRNDEAWAEFFPGLPSISIDYGVMEKSKRVSLLRGDFGWNDVGSWDALEEVIQGESGNVSAGLPGLFLDAKRCITHGEKTLVACLGVEDLVVVATGDAVLVARKDRAQQIRQLVEKLKEEGLTEYL